MSMKSEMAAMKYLATVRKKIFKIEIHTDGFYLYEKIYNLNGPIWAIFHVVKLPMKLLGNINER